MSRLFSWWLRSIFVVSLIIVLASQAQARMTSGSTTDADGNTVTITKNADGTTTRTTTTPDGQVLNSSTTAPEPPTTVPPRQPGTSGSTTNPDGTTTTITKNPDGTTTRTVTGPDGQVIESGPLTAPPPTTVPPRQPGTSGSTTNPDGTTTTITKNPDGTTTRTVTSPDGRVVSSGPVTPEPPTHVPPHQPGTSASTTDANGNAVTITKNPDGTTTRTVTGPNGQVLESGPLTAPPPTTAAPRQPGTSASTTNPDGTTTTITKNPDGTTTRTITGPDGQVISSGPLTPEPPTTVPSRQPGTSASTKDADGNTITITKNPDGTTTRTITDSSGHVISSGPLTPPPPTKVPKRPKGTWASTTDEHGNTITIQTQPDGTRVRTITSPDGKILKTEPLVPSPAGAQLLYNTVTKDDCTLNTAMVLNTEGGKSLLDVSLLATGKGTNFRTWVPGKTFLVVGKDKFKPVATKPYYVEKESAVAHLAPALFAVIGAQYAEHADKAESSKGTPCPLTGKVEEKPQEKRGKFARAIDDVGLVAGVSLLASQAKGQIEGRRLTFDVTGHENQLLTATVLAQIMNTDTSRINLVNQKDEIDIKVPVNFKVD